jgi:hypothetical protein
MEDPDGGSSGGERRARAIDFSDGTHMTRMIATRMHLTRMIVTAWCDGESQPAGSSSRHDSGGFIK